MLSGLRQQQEASLVFVTSGKGFIPDFWMNRSYLSNFIHLWKFIGSLVFSLAVYRWSWGNLFGKSVSPHPFQKLFLRVLRTLRFGLWFDAGGCYLFYVGFEFFLALSCGAASGILGNILQIETSRPNVGCCHREHVLCQNMWCGVGQ